MTPRALTTLLLCLGLVTAGCEGDKHDDHDDHSGHKGHAEGGESSDEVHLTEKQFKSAGIKVEKAGPGVVPTHLTLTAAVEANLDTQAHVTPRVGGLVRAIHKHLGDAVKKGDLICEIDSVELGKVVNSYLGARTRLAASRAILAQEKALLARSVQIAQTVFDRETKLKKDEITTLRPYYAAEQALAQAKLSRDRRFLALQSRIKEREIELHSAMEQLAIFGRTEKEIAALSDKDTHGHGRYQIRAPRSGIIVSRHITENEFVDTSNKLFRIVDLSHVWVLASVYEKDLPSVHKNQVVEVTLSAFPGVRLPGTVHFVDYQVDPKTRACRVRIVLENRKLPGWKEEFPIRPGMFGTVKVVVNRRKAQVVLPEAAVVHEGEQTFVFVKDKDEERAFRRRKVVLGARSTKLVEVTEGIKAGELVAVSGTFTLKSIARQGELGGGHSH